MTLVLIGVFAGLLLLVWLLAPRGVPWAQDLVRLHPGAGERAEWMAEPAVVQAVKRDYLATQTWLAGCAHDWGQLASELEDHAAGSYLRRQRAVLAQLVQSRGPRLAAVVSAEHQLAVHQFSPDGLRCLLIDRQTRRQVTTSYYWSRRALQCQPLPDSGLVLRMLYDPPARRWKIERLIQRLPASGETEVRLAVMSELPAAAGRDN